MGDARRRAVLHKAHTGMKLYTAYERRFYAELERFGLIADGKLTEEGLKELNAVRNRKILTTGENKTPWYRKP